MMGCRPALNRRHATAALQANPHIPGHKTDALPAEGCCMDRGRGVGAEPVRAGPGELVCRPSLRRLHTVSSTASLQYAPSSPLALSTTLFPYR